MPGPAGLVAQINDVDDFPGWRGHHISSRTLPRPHCKLSFLHATVSGFSVVMTDSGKAALLVRVAMAPVLSFARVFLVDPRVLA